MKKLDLNDPLFSYVQSDDFSRKILNIDVEFLKSLNGDKKYDEKLEQYSDDMLYYFLLNKYADDRLILTSTLNKYCAYDAIAVDDEKKTIYLCEMKVRDLSLNSNYEYFLEEKKYSKLQKVKDFMLNKLQTYTVKILYINYFKKYNMYSVFDITNIDDDNISKETILMNITTASSTTLKKDKEVYKLPISNKKCYNYLTVKDDFSTKISYKYIKDVNTYIVDFHTNIFN